MTDSAMPARFDRPSELMDYLRKDMGCMSNEVEHVLDSVWANRRTPIVRHGVKYLLARDGDVFAGVKRDDGQPHPPKPREAKDSDWDCERCILPLWDCKCPPKPPQGEG